MSAQNELVIPKPGRPRRLEGYRIPTSEEGLLSWDFVVEKMTQARNYWIATTCPDGRPHTVPVWGIWLDDRLHFGGGPQTRWSRNLAQNPQVAVHIGDGNEAVMIEGRVAVIADPQAEIMKRLDDAYEVKYNLRHGPPIWVLQPRKVFAWQAYPQLTRWIFK